MSNSTDARVMRLQHRETGEMSGHFDVTGWSARQFDRMFDGLVRQVDFATWCPIYEPPRGPDETIEQWLA